MEMAQKKIIAIEGPSGVGKDTIIKHLILKNPDKYRKIPSYTNRPMRTNEVEGFTYHFIDDETFAQKLESGDIFEHTQRHGTYRGMSKDLIDEIINNGYWALKDCDLVGLNALKGYYGESVFSIFINADKDVVRERLEKRGDIDIAVRLADYDTKQSEQPYYDLVITNNGSLEEVINKLNEIIGGLK